RVASGGSFGPLDTKSNASSVHGLVGSGPLHLSTTAWVAGVRRAAASLTARRSAMAWSESRPGGGGTSISLPLAMTHVLQSPAVDSAPVTGLAARLPPPP